MEILNSSNINNKFINSYVLYPSIPNIEYSYFYNNQDVISEKIKLWIETINFINNTLNKDDSDTYSLSCLISNDFKLGIFATTISNIGLDINNLKDMSWDFVKTLYVTFYNKFINGEYNNIYNQSPILNHVLEKEYNAPNDMYYINNLFFYRSFPIFNFLIYTQRNNLLSNINKNFDYDYDSMPKLLNNVLFDLIYIDGDINTYKRNIVNLLNSDNNIINYIILKEEPGRKDLFESLKTNTTRVIDQTNNIYMSLVYILNFIHNDIYSIGTDINHSNFENNNQVNNILTELITNKNYNMIYYLLYISKIVFCYEFLNHIRDHFDDVDDEIELKNLMLNDNNEVLIKQTYRRYFNNNSLGKIYCDNLNLQLVNPGLFELKKFYNTLKFIDNIKNSQQSKLLMFLCFSNTKYKFVLNDGKTNTLFNELLTLYDFENTIIIYPQKKL